LIASSLDLGCGVFGFGHRWIVPLSISIRRVVA
jgi:hypothetical protein